MVKSSEEVQDAVFALGEDFPGIVFADIHVKALHNGVFCAFIFNLCDGFDKLFEIGQISTYYLLDDLLFILLVYVPSLLVLDDNLFIGLEQAIQHGFVF